MAVEAPVRTAARPDLTVLDRWWRAANYLSVGQIYLMDNPLLREPLRPEPVKPRLETGALARLTVRHAGLRQEMADRRLRCRRYTREHGEDAPEVADWVWPG